MRTRLLLIVAAGLLLLLYGCAGKPSAPPPVAEGVTLSKEEVLVFGRVLVTENGRAMAVGTKVVPKMAHTGFQQRREFTLGVKAGGYFFWLARPNHAYGMTEIDCGAYKVEPRARFIAPYGGTAFYTGTLTVDVRVKDGAFIGVNSIKVVDDYEAATKEMKKSSHGAGLELIKEFWSLMKPEP